MEEAGLVELEFDRLRVTAAGWFLVRAVAAVFDRHLRHAQGQQASERLSRFSRVV